MRFYLLSFCAALLLAAVPTWADSTVSYSHTTGSQSFNGQHIGLQLGSDSSSFGGSYDSSSSDALSGTFKTYSLNIGEDVGGASWNIFGSITPKQDLYDAQSVGFVINTDAGPQTKSQLGYTRTWHKDGVPLPENVNQNDLLAGLTYAVGKMTLSGNFTKTLYDEDISNLSLRPAAYMPIMGMTQTPQDYPSYWINSKIGLGLLTWLKAWVSYTRVQYEEGVTGAADSYTAGADATWHNITLSAQYNEFVPTNGDTNKYVSIGAGLGF
jgi:hypothetical protein